MRPLNEVLEWHKVTRACYRTVAKNLNASPGSFPLDNIFVSKPVHEIRTSLSIAVSELDDLTVVALVSVFEQQVLDYLRTTTATTIRNSSDPFENSVMKYALKRAENWRFPDILDFFKPVVGSTLAGEAKQIYQYRNWVAHGRRKEKPVSVDPLTAYKRLAEFMLRYEENRKTAK